MQKDLWQDQFGYLEEQIERLQGIAYQNEANTLDPLSPPPASLQHQLEELREQALHLEELVTAEVFRQKNIASSDLLVRIARYLMEEAGKNSIPISLAYYGSGRMGMTMVEQVMPAIIFSAKACIANYRKENLENLRAKNHLFPTCSIYLEIKASENELGFRIVDDGFGFEWGRKAIREHVAKMSGRVAFHKFSNYGGSLDIRLPVARSRTDSVIFSYGPNRVAVPNSVVHEECYNYKREDLIAEGENWCVNTKYGAIKLCTIHPSHGIQFVEEGADYVGKTFFVTTIGVADFRVAILTDQKPDRRLLRVIKDSEWLDEDSWFTCLGLHAETDGAIALPFLDGLALMKFYKTHWK